MVKFLLLISLSFSLLFASSIEKEVENIIGKGSFAAQKGLISVLFKKRSDFYKGNRIDMLKVVQTLEANRLLDLQFEKRRDLQLSFATTQNKPLFFIKMVKETLNALGYNHLLTTKAVRDESGFLWKVTIQTASVVDPLLLTQELEKRGAYLTGIKRYSKDNWRYNVNIRRAHLMAKKIPFNEKVLLKKPLNDYWIEVSGARAVVFDSRNGNNWHPYITFYDRDLNILDIYTKERKSYNISLKIPRETKYVKIGDLYTLKNIRRGLKIYIQKR